MIHLFYDPLLFSMPNQYVKIFYLVVLLVDLLIDMCFVYTLSYLFVIAGKFLWPNCSFIRFSFSHNVLIPCFITSMSLFSSVSLVISIIYVYTHKKIKFSDVYFLFWPNKIISFVSYQSHGHFFKKFDFTVLNLVISYFSFSLLKLSFIFSYLCFSFEVVISSSWLISMSINACDFLFLFLAIFSNFLTIERSRKKICALAFAIPIGAPPLVALKIIKAWSV